MSFRRVTRLASCGTLHGIGAAFDAGLIPTLVAPDQDIVTHDFSE